MKVRDFLEGEKIYRSNDLIKNPIVSILLPTYCRGDSGLLERSINSVINQSFKEWELIIIDDGSKDCTSEVVKKFLEKDNRIIYIRNEKNSGLPALRESQGMLHSRGKYIAYQFDDDIWNKNMLEVMVDKLSKLGDLAFVYGKGKFINSVTNAYRIHGEVYDSEKMKNKGNLILNNTVVHSKELPYLYGSYDCHVTMRRLCDWDLWRRWEKYVELTFVNEVITAVEYSYNDSISENTNRNNYIVELMQKVDRTKVLNLYNIEEYEIDNIDIVEDIKLQQKILEEDILPWKKKCNIKD